MSVEDELKQKEAAYKILKEHLILPERLKSKKSFKRHVVNHEFPVLALFMRKDNPRCQKTEERLKRALIKTHGKFRLCLIDADEIDDDLRDAFNIQYTPSLFLFYRHNIAQEYRGTIRREKLMEFVRAAEFYHTIATEERLVIQLISEGLHFIESKKWEDAISLLDEAESLERWIDLYGGKIYSSLAFANA